MTFTVTDSLGTPVPQALVNFSVATPALVTLNRTSAATDATGKVVIDYSSGTEAGVTTLTATVASTGARTSHSIAVRGAKPSAANFSFRCEHASLPVYVTVSQHETMTCTVRLADRAGNRVGIPTAVAFATEAGMIAATATTKAFDPNDPNDPDEGSASVTFSTDLGNGSSPADVDPLPAATQYPFDRAAEPSIAYGSLLLNPRDQLVTIIAMTRGEEGFEDANHNGVLDPNEVFVDQGDPFVDANDDGVYDQVGPAADSLWEIRFCGLNPDCSTWHGPNGVWDSDTVIWKPTWVVFTANASASTTPAGGVSPATDFTLPCADYADTSGAGHDSLITAPVYVYDTWLNVPPAGTSAGVGSANTSLIQATGFGLGGSAFEAWGSMGVLGFDFVYQRVAAAGPNAGKACSIGNGQACVEKLLFQNFSDGFAGLVAVQNGVKVPATSAKQGASSTGFGCAPNADQYGFANFILGIVVNNAHGVSITSAYRGQFAHGG
jgi:hypothetical protein